MSDIIEKQIEIYRPNYLKHRNTPLGSFQNNVTTQFERYENLLKPLLKYKDSNFSICDIGCGTCDLHKYLNENEISHHYTGIEIVPEIIEDARKAHPDVEILNIDFLAESFANRFDFVVLSGMLNIPGQSELSTWEAFIFNCITKMFESAEIGISFNALTTYTSFRSEELYYLDPSKVLDFINTNLTRFWQLDSSSPLFEITYTALQPSTVKNTKTHPDFNKYFGG